MLLDKGYEVMLSAIANIDPNLIINLKSHNEKHDVFEVRIRIVSFYCSDTNGIRR